MRTSGITSLAVTAIALCITSAVSLNAQDKSPGWNAAQPEKQDKPRTHEQPKIMRMAFDADHSVMINEVGMVVAEKDGKLSVAFIPPKEARPKDAAGLDIMGGDEIGMAAGKPVSSAKLLREAYESVRPGDEVKLGLRREGKSFIVVFTKKDGEHLPGRMVIRTDGDEDPNLDVLPALGIAISAGENGLAITETFPNAPDEMETGDIIETVNGKTVKTLQDFSGVYDRAEIGSTLKFGLLREGKKVTVVTTRNEMHRKMIVK